MEGNGKNALLSLKKIISSVFHLKLLLVIVIIIVLLVSSLYVIKGKEIAYAEDNEKNVPANVASLTNNVSIDQNGGITSSLTVQQLWDQLVENESNITKYLDSAEELSKLINAQLVTQYMDTREDPDDKIEWNDIFQDLDSTNVQGIIKMKRADSEGNEVRMTYAPRNVFDSYLEEYNYTGSAESREYLRTHFTLEEVVTTEGGNNQNVVTSGKQADVSAAIVNEVIQKKTYGLGKKACQAWVGSVYEAAGFGYVASGCCAFLAGQRWGVSSDFSQIVNGAAVWTGEGSYRATQCSDHPNGGCGHAGIYYKDGNGNDWVLHLVNGNVKQDTLQHWLDYYGEGNTPVWGWQGGIKVEMEGETTTTTTTTTTSNLESVEVVSTLADTETVSTDTEVTTTTESTDISNSISNTSSKGCCAVIAVFEEIGYSEETNDKEETLGESYTQYHAEATKFYYQSMTSGYTMPFNYLWTWLVLTENKNFAMDLADLVYESEIEFTVYEKYNGLTTIEEVDYTRYKEVNTYAYGEVLYNDFSADEYDSGYCEDSEYKNAKDGGQFYHLYKTTTNEQMINVLLTTADVWMCKYELDYESAQETDDKEVSDPISMEDEKVASTQMFYGVDGLDDKNTELGITNLESIRNKILDDHKGATSIGWNTVKHTYHETKVEQSKTTTTITKTYDYVSASPTITEKVDPNSDEPNFVTLYIASQSARQAVRNLDSWLYAYLNMNDDTKDLVDLTKYLIYKAEGKDYGITEFNFESLWTKSYNGMTNISGDDIIVYTEDDSVPVIKDVETLKKAFSGYSGSSKLIENAQTFLDLQEKYKVNALFAAAVSIEETSAGRAGHAIDGKYNWFSIECKCGNNSHGRYETYSSDKETIEVFYKLIANGTRYFKQGNYSVRTIGNVGYCENAEVKWIPEVLQFMTQMYNAAGISVSTTTTSVSSIVDAAVAVHKELRTSGYTYNNDTNKSVPNYKTKQIDCSSYVTWVLVKAGVSGFTDGMAQKTSSTFYSNPWGWKEVSSDEAQPGDIICYTDHVEILASKQTKNGSYIVYNCGSNSAIKATGTSELPESSTSKYTTSSTGIKFFRVTN